MYDLLDELGHRGWRRRSFRRDPTTIGALILDAVLAQSTGWGTTMVVVGAISPTTLATGIGSAVLLGASVGAGYAFQQRDNPRVPNNPTEPLKQGTPPRIFGYGRARVAGAYMFYDAKRVLQGTSFDVLALHHGKVNGFCFWYLNNDIVARNAGTGVVSDVWYADGRYASAVVTIEIRYGNNPETYYSTVAANFPTQWNTGMLGNGIASACLHCAGVTQATFFNTYPHGLPKLSVAMDLTAVFDPRDIAQSQATPSTWKTSRNPVLQIMDFLTSSDHGLGLSYATLIQPQLSAWIAQANICDQLVTRNDGGIEKRYESSGTAYLSTDPAEVLAAILATCDGWLAEGPDGTIRITVGQYVAPSVTLTDDHIVAVTIDHGVPDQEDVNEIRFTYSPPANDYRQTEGDPWIDAAGLAITGRTRAKTVNLDWVHSHTQGRRLAKRAMARHQAALRGTMVTTLYGLQCLGQRWVAAQSGIMSDLTNAVIEIGKAKIDLMAAKVTFDWILTNPGTIDAWNAATEDGQEPYLGWFLSSANVVAPVPIALADAGGHVISLTINPSQNPQLRYSVTYQLTSGAGGPLTTIEVTEPPIDANVVTIPIATGAAGTYAVTVAYRKIDGTLTGYASAGSITIA